MAQSDNIKSIAKTGIAAIEAVKKHSDFVAEVHAKYDAASKTGTINLSASGIYREYETLVLAVSDSYDFSDLPTQRLTAQHKNNILGQQAHFNELKKFYDPKGQHQRYLKKTFRHEPLTTSETEAYEKGADHVRTSIFAYGSAVSRAGIFDNDTSQTTPTAPADPGRDQPLKGDGNMPHDSDKDLALDGIVDAISRLQGQGGPGGFGSDSYGNVYSAFGAAIDQKIQLTLGIPSLSSDSALGMDRNDLTSKLLDGLDRTVATSEYGGVSHYSFNPLLARGGLIGVEDFALGAQAVAAETIRNLKPVFMTNVHKLVPETVIGDQDEADDLRIAIEDGLEKLATEAGSEMGVYSVWAAEIINTIFCDLMALADMYDIREPRRHARQPYKRFDYAAMKFSDNLDQNVTTILDMVSFNPAKQRVLADPDIGILTAESNDRALFAMLSKLMLMGNLALGHTELGPLLGRVRVLNNTLASSVISARSALAAAGISESDQAVTYNTGEASSIDLRRLLAWIETESLTARPILLRMDLNPSDLRRLLSARATQAKAVGDIMAANFPTVNNNRYAHGRRQLAEVQQHLCNLVDMLTVLIHESTDHKKAG